jgi:hypothetical protein
MPGTVRLYWRKWEKDNQSNHLRYECTQYAQDASDGMECYGMEKHINTKKLYILFSVLNLFL